MEDYSSQKIETAQLELAGTGSGEPATLEVRQNNTGSNSKKVHSAKFRYRADIDGLRALAVVPVILFHFGLGFPGGFAGVDVFFVISGYLITAIQLRRLNKGTFSILEFWGRRVRRLFPACTLMLVVLMAVGHFTLFAVDYARLAAQAQATQLFGANFYFFMEQPYFFDHLEAPLLHCWSLAVEEQYYFMYPLILQALWWPGLSESNGKQEGSTIAPTVTPLSTVRTRRLFWVLILLSAGSLFASATLSETEAQFAYYLLPTRIWEMSLGGLIVTWGPAWSVTRCASPRVFTDVLNELVCWVSIGLLFVSYFIFSDRTPYPGIAALLPCLGTAVFIVTSSTNVNEDNANKPRGLPLPQCSFCCSCFRGVQRIPSIGQFLSLSPFVLVGKASYSLYLWHWPIYVLIAYNTVDGRLTGIMTGLGLLASFGAGFASYFFVEPFFRDPKMLRDGIFFKSSFMVWAALLSFVSLAAALGFGGIQPGPLAKIPYRSLNVSGYEWMQSQCILMNSTRTNTTNAPVVLGLKDEGECANQYQGRWLDGWCSFIGFPGDKAFLRNVNETECVALNDKVRRRKGKKCTCPNGHCVPFLNKYEIMRYNTVPSSSVNSGNIQRSPGWTQGYASYDYCKGPCIYRNEGAPKSSPRGGILIIGDSHCLQYSVMLRNMASQYDIPITFVCRNAPVYPSTAASLRYMKDSYLEDMKPEVLVVLSLFLYADDADWSGVEIPWVLQRVSSKTRIVLFGDNPMLPGIGAGCNDCARRVILNRFREEGSFAFLDTMQETSATARLFTNSMYYAAENKYDQVSVFDISTYFQWFDPAVGGNVLHIVNPQTGMLDYKDNNHVNAMGAWRVEQLFRREIFLDPECM